MNQNFLTDIVSVFKANPSIGLLGCIGGRKLPLRLMEYDVREYQRQAVTIRKKVRKKEKLTAVEFLSGFSKDNKLHPCVTFVLYYGDDWDGGCELHDLLDFTDIPERLKALVNNYKIHLIEIKKLKDTSVFRTDLKQVFENG